MQSDISSLPRRAVESFRGQFASTLKMLKTFVEVCPREVWESCYFGFSYPVWYQVFHASFFIDFWIRDAYDGSEYRCMVFDERIPPEYEHEVDPSLMVSREDILVFLDKLKIKTDRFFDNLHDGMLGEPIVKGDENFTYADVVVGQIRHVMYNIGYLNGILRSLDLPESDWYSYNEKED
jgi:hypothetical protein